MLPSVDMRSRRWGTSLAVAVTFLVLKCGVFFFKLFFKMKKFIPKDIAFYASMFFNEILFYAFLPFPALGVKSALLHTGDRKRPGATSSPFVVCCTFARSPSSQKKNIYKIRKKNTKTNDSRAARAITVHWRRAIVQTDDNYVQYKRFVGLIIEERGSGCGAGPLPGLEFRLPVGCSYRVALSRPAGTWSSLKGHRSSAAKFDARRPARLRPLRPLLPAPLFPPPADAPTRGAPLPDGPSIQRANPLLWLPTAISVSIHQISYLFTPSFLFFPYLLLELVFLFGKSDGHFLLELVVVWRNIKKRVRWWWCFYVVTLFSFHCCVTYVHGWAVPVGRDADSSASGFDCAIRQSRPGLLQ